MYVSHPRLWHYLLFIMRSKLFRENKGKNKEIKCLIDLLKKIQNKKTLIHACYPNAIRLQNKQVNNVLTSYYIHIKYYIFSA